MTGIDSSRAVSPVIGVILMVAITVLLAATAATFFMGFEGELSGTPTVAIEGEFAVDSGGHELAVEFTGGDVLARENVAIHVASAGCRGVGSVTDRYDLAELGVSGSTVAAGSQAQVTVGTVCPPAASRLDLSRTEVTVSWVDPGGDGTVLYRWRGPAA
ncbi:type IV pilin [Halosimplex halophilum]|uniref:type IV pilin n=1 Tax=Halosimplex halophilum TaxID=2559572 RepID=UPI001FE30448|nr:type IV pilin N-terminal domain-containing protein [Halosimplex halophilum]